MVEKTELALHKFQFGSVTGESIPAGPHEISIVVEEQLATSGDVNRDGQVVSISGSDPRRAAAWGEEYPPARR